MRFTSRFTLAVTAILSLAACQQQADATQQPVGNATQPAGTFETPAGADPERPWLTGITTTTTTTLAATSESAAPTTTTTTTPPPPPPPPCRPAVRSGSDVLFAPKAATLTPEASTALARTVSDLCGTLDTPIEVIGHTDSDGTDEYNQELSEQRAQAVAAALHSLGFTKVTASGAGETQPIAANSSLEGRERNRRVVIAIFGGST